MPLPNLEPWLTALERRGARPDGTPRPAFVASWIVVAYVLFAVSYTAINNFSIGRAASVLWLPGETRIPFIPEAEYLYLLTYPLPVLAVWRLPDVRRLVQMASALALILAVSYATYLLFPVHLERPTLVVDSLATWLVSLEYLDPSYNHFPSLHVSLSWLVWLACRERLRFPRAFAGLVVGICASTMLIKQHYFADVVAGFVLAMVAWRVAGSLVSSPDPRAVPAAE